MFVTACTEMAGSVASTLCLLLWAFCVDCSAQQSASPGTDLRESLSEEVNDPTAILTQVQVREFFSPSEYSTNAQTNTLQGRFVLAFLPHSLLPLAQLVRPTFSLLTPAPRQGRFNPHRIW